MVDIFNRLRKKRHRVVYEEAGAVSEEEARKALEWAGEFVRRTGEILSMQLGF